MKGLDALAEIIRLAQPAVAMAFELDGDGERRILGIVEQLLGRALRKRREASQLVDQRIDRRLKPVVGDAVRCDAPLRSLATRNPLRAHHNILGARDPDDLLQPRRSA